MSDRVLVTADVMAVRWGYKSTHAFMQAVTRRKIPKVYIGRSVRFDVSECDRWLADQNPRPGRPLPRRARANQPVAAPFGKPSLIHGPERNNRAASVPRELINEIRGLDAEGQVRV